MTDEEKLRAEISAQVFDESAGTPPDDTPASSAQAAVIETAEVDNSAIAAQPEDEWAGIAPALRARFEALQSTVSEFDTVKSRLKQAEQRLGAATNELSEMKKRPAPVAEPVISDSQKKFREEYPDLAGSVEERIAALRAEVLEKSPAIDEKALREQVKAELAFEMAVERVEEAHPGWQDKKQTPEFRNWQKTADPAVQALATSARAVDAIRMLDAYEAFRKTQKTPAQIEAERQKRLEQSQSTPGRKLTAAKSQADMSPAELRASIANEVWT